MLAENWVQNALTIMIIKSKARELLTLTKNK